MLYQSKDSIFVTKGPLSAVISVFKNEAPDLYLARPGAERAKVGIRLSVLDRRVSYILEVDAKGQIGGTTTSGLGRRSFTKGIASAVVAAV